MVGDVLAPRASAAAVLAVVGDLRDGAKVSGAAEPERDAVDDRA